MPFYRRINHHHFMYHHFINFLSIVRSIEQMHRKHNWKCFARREIWTSAFSQPTVFSLARLSTFRSAAGSGRVIGVPHSLYTTVKQWYFTQCRRLSGSTAFVAHSGFARKLYSESSGALRTLPGSFIRY